MMKRIFCFSIVITLLLLTSCETWLDVNTDPDNPETASEDVVFASGVASAAGQIGGYYNIAGSMWSQYWTQSNAASQYTGFDAYNIQTRTMQGNFNELFRGALTDFKWIKDASKTDDNWGYYLMATVMEAYVFQFLVDLYDQVPFDEACRADEGLYTPVYRNGQDIYDSLIVRIDNALAKDLTLRSVKYPGNQDMLFEGDWDEWIRFANTLKLKIYLRQVNVRPLVAEEGIKAMVDAGDEFLSTHAGMDVFSDAEGKSNPVYESDQRKLNNTNNIKASNTLMSFLLDNADPRTDSLFIAGSEGQAGMVQGNFNALISEVNPGNISGALIQPNDPVYFLSDAESYFLQAEAMERYYSGTGAKELYDMGVMASFEKYGLSDTGRSFINTGGKYEYPEGGDFESKLESIIVQKWISMTGSQGMEAFFERNRTGYPVTSAVPGDDENYVPGRFTYPVEGVTNGIFIQRLLFTEDEYSQNPVNTPERVPAITPVWWNR